MLFNIKKRQNNAICCFINLSGVYHASKSEEERQAQSSVPCVGYIEKL